MAALTLVSHALCPYVQRAAIVLLEKGQAFERRWVDLAAKPDWFLALSPLGKTPVLQVGNEAVFESAVICEYLDETCLPRLHPEDALARARERGWMQFGSAVLDAIAALYSAPDAGQLAQRAERLQALFGQVEAALGDGPWFAGPRFGLVDACFAPVFRYFDVLDAVDDFAGLRRLPRVQAWRARLAARPSVQAAALPDHAERLQAFLRQRGSALSVRLAA